MPADLWALLPEVCVTVTLLAVLLVASTPAASASRATWLLGVSVVGLLLSAVALGFASDPDRAAFSGMIAVDGFAVFFRGLFLVAALLGVVFGGLSDEVERSRLGEYLVLILSITLGLLLLGAAQNLLMVYLALELVSLPSYVLAGFRRHDPRSSEAALKYVVYGGVASGLMLYGFSLLYGIAGSLSFADLAQAVAGMGEHDPTERLGLVMAGGLSLAGFGYKVAAVPFHMWCPDVYEGAPTPFVAFLSVAPKAGGMAALLRFLTVGLGLADPSVSSRVPWPIPLAVVSVITMTLGNLAAIPQQNLKRLLAYSSIAHAGYMLMGVAVGSEQALRSVMFYLAVYLPMNFGAFLVVMAIRAATGEESIAGYRGLATRSPWLAAALAVFLFSLTGLPPFAGFIGKFYLFTALLEAHRGLFYWVALAGVLNSAVSLYYYARVVKAMYLEKAGSAPAVAAIRVELKGVLVTLGAATLVLGVWWTPLSETIDRLSTVLR
jgi:NADH-quinone oxidoreductase subunit N